MTSIICFMWTWCKHPFTTTGVVSEHKSHCWTSNSPGSSHPFTSTADSSFPAKITWCNLHKPSRCWSWWMPTIHTRPSRILHKSTFITGDNHYVLFHRFHPTLTRSISPSFVSAQVLKRMFTHYYLFLRCFYTISMLHVCCILLL